ncbi:DNA protecting protein DprA [Paenibacillus selenitireducens]|uniref:DNA protecting protein DprA n=1 Tax=Paenibacillus selenitireducens TaxID=1324314 RepID=A0A1T2XD89_9BACL|nr:DNA-processing protein DprA [Paenibacillus selenitireducens]OPA77583.1 DNA protecting protein DprA [Paenibacillus selenitireducens]
MEENMILFGLHQLEGIGARTIHVLMKKLHSLHELFTLDKQDLVDLGLTQDKASYIAQQLTPDNIDAWLEGYKQRQIGIITILDPEYPELLKETPAPPWVLYTIGNTSLLQEPSIGMVGTRVPTAYGKKVSEFLSRDLCGAGFTIVSGLARGIDSCCHAAALQVQGRTIAVLGTGIHAIYPPENRSLHEEIAAKGLVISEYPIGTKSHPGLFPQRNRIIAGLSLGTVVVEADIKSGSLITADAALEASREVFAVPGPITSPKSLGALNLIRQGAKLVMTANDIIEEFQTWNRVSLQPIMAEPYSSPELTSDELNVYRLIEPAPIGFDELLEKCESNFGHLHSVLLSLLIKKVISQLPGSVYIAN